MPESPTNTTSRLSFAEKMQGLAIVAAFHMLSILPFFVLRKLGAALGLILWWANGRNRKITEINLALCFPNKTVLERRTLARQSIIESTKTLFEVVAIWRSPLKKNQALIKKVTGFDCLDEARKKKCGVMILAPHLGNWELVGMFCAQLGPFTAMYAPAKIDALDKIMFAGRQQFGCKLAPTNTQGVKTLLKALRAGEGVGILPDQVPEPEGGLFAPFFGQPAFTMTLIANLAARTGATVICGYAKRLHDETGFEICLRPAGDKIASENLHEAVEALNQSVEACVRDCPEQYQWEYKRFKKRPAGQTRPY